MNSTSVMDNKALEIIQEATQLFQRYGIKSISMEELSRQLGISKKTLYQYFEDKTALVDKVVEQIIEKKNCDFLKLTNEGVNALEELFEVYRMAREMVRDHNPGLEFDLQKFYPTIFKRIRENFRQMMYASTVRNLDKGKAEGLYRQNFDTTVVAKLHVIRIENLMNSDMVTLEEIHSDHFFKEVFNYHLHGIISRKGYQYIETHHPEFIENE